MTQMEPPNWFSKNLKDWISMKFGQWLPSSEEASVVSSMNRKGQKLKYQNTHLQGLLLNANKYYGCYLGHSNGLAKFEN